MMKNIRRKKKLAHQNTYIKPGNVWKSKRNTRRIAVLKDPISAIYALSAKNKEGKQRKQTDPMNARNS